MQLIQLPVEQEEESGREMSICLTAVRVSHPMRKQIIAFKEAEISRKEKHIQMQSSHPQM